MKRNEYEQIEDKNKRIIKEISDMEASGKKAQQVEIATPKEFSEFVSELDKINEKGKRSYTTSETVNEKQIDDAYRDVNVELERQKQINDTLLEFAEKYKLISHENEEDYVLGVEKKVSELFERLKNKRLTPEEISDLKIYVKDMNFNALLRNYIELGLSITRNNMEELEKQASNRVLMIFKPLRAKLAKKIEDYNSFSHENIEKQIAEIESETEKRSSEMLKSIEDNNDKLYESLLEEDFERIKNSVVSEIELDKLLKELDRAKAEYDKIETSDKAFYSQEEIEKREEAWNTYVGYLMDSIIAMQTMHLKNAYNDVQKYKVSDVASGNMICCKVGNEYISVSKNNLENDIELFYRKLKEYENSLNNKEEPALEEPKLKEDNIVSLENKEPIKEKEESVILNEPQEPIVEEKTVEEPITSSSEIPPTEQKITSSKQAYIEFMACFVSREEAMAYATDENVNTFETSNIGFNKYLSEINSGKIASDTTYEAFIVDKLQKDNGIKYDSPVTEISTNDQTPITNEPDFSGFDVFVTNPVQLNDDSMDLSPKTK